MNRLNTLQFGAVLLILATSCRATASAVGMTPTKFGFEPTTSASAWVETETAGRLLGVIPERVPNGEVNTALKRALQESGLFQLASQPLAADYQLHVAFDVISESRAALDMEAVILGRWTLENPADGMTIWAKSIETSHEASTFDSSSIAERGLMALEGAVKANIKEGLTAISKLPSLRGPAGRNSPPK